MAPEWPTTTTTPRVCPATQGDIIPVCWEKKKDAQQLLLPDAFKQCFPASSDRAKAITKSIGVFIAADMRPYSVVENKGFKNMIKVLEPRYEIPSRTHFTTKIVPALYEEQKKIIVDELSKASSVALTTDGWTSRATESLF